LALGSSGCLLFTDPINEAPKVKILPHPDPVYRGIATDFYVQVSDDGNPPPGDVRWWEFDTNQSGSCTSVTAASWASLPFPGPIFVPRDAPHAFKTIKHVATCLCVQAIDQDGAAGQDCSRIEPDTQQPLAKITAISGAPIASQQPKCSQIQLSATWSTFVKEDDIQFKWTLDYVGADPTGKQTQLTNCTGLIPPRPDEYKCLYAAAPGVYNVTLTVTDTPLDMDGATSAPATLGITILEDTPACLEQTTPVMTARLILLGSSGSLGQSRTFTVDSVKDDCEPYPPRRDTPTLQESTFVWSVLDGTSAKPQWVVQANPANSNSFTIDQQNFPNARPGDTLGLRVEIRDTPAQLLHQTTGPACVDDSTVVCCGSGGCTGTNDCVRWTTWTVEFQP
jgi:hypothetical protein